MTPLELCRLHPFLAALTEVEVRDLLKRAHVRRLAAEDVVFRKGDPGDGLYGVLAGRVVVLVESAAGKELILNMFGPGEFFGEIALLDGKGRTATAVARDAAELLFLSRAEFLPFLRRHHEAAARIIAFLCGRLRRTTDLVEDAAFLNASTRLAKQLAALAGGTAPAATIRLSQEELARTLGVSREIVSRQLSAWRDAGVVEIGRGRIVVRDVGALDRIVAGG
jgi:CRP-like cAMP-binding protein